VAARRLENRASVSASNDVDRNRLRFRGYRQKPGGRYAHFPDVVTLSYRPQLADVASKRNLPSMFGWKEYAVAGGLISGRIISPVGSFCRQNLERRQAGRPSRGAADEVRAGDQSQDCKTDRLNHTPECLSQSRQGNSMTEQSRIQNLS
jgi:hypothetical protein